MNNDSSSCILCPSGTYFSLSLNQSTACKPCAPGTFSSNSGSQFCDLCQANSFSGPGASICSLCQRYSSSPAAASQCICDAGVCLFRFCDVSSLFCIMLCVSSKPIQVTLRLLILPALPAVWVHTMPLKFRIISQVGCALRVILAISLASLG